MLCLSVHPAKLPLKAAPPVPGTIADVRLQCRAFPEQPQWEPGLVERCCLEDGDSIIQHALICVFASQVSLRRCTCQIMLHKNKFAASQFECGKV